jgi:hypothetical protein
VLTVSAGNTVDIGKASTNVVLNQASTTGWTAAAWCVGVNNPAGSLRTYKYSAQNGLEQGLCTSPTAP